MKLELIQRIINDYYEFLYSDDPVKSSATLEALFSCISAIADYEDADSKKEHSCSGCGECSNCME